MSKQKLDISQYKVKPIVTPGVKHVENKIIDISMIYIPDMVDNPLRTDGLELDKVEALTMTLANGIDYSRRAPIVRRNPRIVDGRTYDYDLVQGYHRMEAMFHAGIQDWIFEVYDFALNKYSYDESALTLGLVTNDHLPQTPSSVNDVVNTISRLIKNNSKLVTNDEKSIGKYVDNYCKNLAYQTRGKIVKMVVAKCGSYQDVVTYTPEQAERWAENQGYSHSGTLDMHRSEYGWITKEGYEKDIIYNASRKFYETGKESYFICYTCAPTKNEDLYTKRKKMQEKIELQNDYLIAVFEFYQNNKRFPWDVEGFIPSDRLVGEDPNTIVEKT